MAGGGANGVVLDMAAVVFSQVVALLVRLQAGLKLHSCGAQAVVVARVLHRLSQTTLVMVATARSGLRMARAVRVGSMSVCEFKQTPLKFRLTVALNMALQL